jgi:dTDP-4-amino-4,6-dideoxygalactose transaminase
MRSVIRTTRRDDLLTSLQADGVGAGIHYPIPLHRQPAYLKRGYGAVHLPVTEAASAQVLSLPIFAELTDEQIGYVTDRVRRFFQ